MTNAFRNNAKCFTLKTLCSPERLKVKNEVKPLFYLCTHRIVVHPALFIWNRPILFFYTTCCSHGVQEAQNEIKKENSQLQEIRKINPNSRKWPKKHGFRWHFSRNVSEVKWECTTSWTMERTIKEVGVSANDNYFR